ncbi:glucose 1-dehydrogenase [Pseudoxanthomonas sp.]|uniref:SDR family NAD(P)-dependent oxidoreductase n=1 Tax=Pseudoxanthomonas sp. TaxID=1871049 RepID=UPI00261D03A2|nr:glucose 1-dehydrogenase [Pseudoxanthomonas sp.]WDS35814.1 MAG: glucose 1-dehydrogenase [Pseudoxanthomonas sp.]
MFSLVDKVALITGAASGIGAATARCFIKQGARVLLTDIREQGAEVAQALGPNARFHRHDVSCEDQWQAVVHEAVSVFGRIDILVNNAGVFAPAPLQVTDQALLDQHYRVNQLGVFLGMKSVIGSMQSAGRGAIVNVSSEAGLQAHPGMFAYVASKWAVRGMTRAAALDLAALRIRVNSIHPGGIDTPILQAVGPEVIEAYRQMIPLHRLGTADEVAAMALYLASDEAAYVTGAELAITGGLGS